MKRIAALLIVLLLGALPALAAHGLAAEAPSFSLYDHHILHTVNGRYVIYEFPDVTLYLPIEWENAIAVEQTEDGIAFYQSASRERYLEEGIASGGFLFQLRSSADESFRELPAFEYLGQSGESGLHYLLATPSDYPAWTGDADIQAGYDAMLGQIGEIVEKAQLRPSMFYYTDGIESTDPGMS